MHKIKTLLQVGGCLLAMLYTSVFLRADVTATVTKNVSYSGDLGLASDTYAAKMYYDDGSMQPLELSVPLIIDVLPPIVLASTKGQRDPYWPQYLIEENGCGVMQIDGVGTLTVGYDGTYSFVPTQDYTGAVPTIAITIESNLVPDISVVYLYFTVVNAPPAGGTLFSSYQPGSEIVVDTSFVNQYRLILQQGFTVPLAARVRLPASFNEIVDGPILIENGGRCILDADYRALFKKNIFVKNGGVLILPSADEIPADVEVEGTLAVGFASDSLFSVLKDAEKKYNAMLEGFSDKLKASLQALVNVALQSAESIYTQAIAANAALYQDKLAQARQVFQAALAAAGAAYDLALQSAVAPEQKKAAADVLKQDIQAAAAQRDAVIAAEAAGEKQARTEWYEAQLAVYAPLLATYERFIPAGLAARLRGRGIIIPLLGDGDSIGYDAQATITPEGCAQGFVVAKNATVFVRENVDVTTVKGKVLVLEGGCLIIEKGKTLNVKGTLENEGTVVAQGDCICRRFINNNLFAWGRDAHVQNNLLPEVKFFENYTNWTIGASGKGVVVPILEDGDTIAWKKGNYLPSACGRGLVLAPQALVTLRHSLTVEATGGIVYLPGSYLAIRTGKSLVNKGSLWDKR